MIDVCIEDGMSAQQRAELMRRKRRESIVSIVEISRSLIVEVSRLRAYLAPILAPHEPQSAPPLKRSALAEQRFPPLRRRPASHSPIDRRR